MSIPSLDRLRTDLGRTYWLSGPWEGRLPAELKSVRERVAMDARYRCYSAELALPHGVRLSQVNCTVDSAGERWPMLLLAPIGPLEDGRQLMQMVFHSPLAQVPVPVPAGA